MTFSQLYGELALKHGITERTFWDYLEALRMAGKIDYPTFYPITAKEQVEITLKQPG